MVTPSLIKDYFTRYYQTQLENKKVNNDLSFLKFRQIKHQSFERRWIIPRTTIATVHQLFRSITTHPDVPAHVYATVLQFLNAPHLTTKETSVLCLSGPYVMDFDQKGHILYAQEGLEELKTRMLDTVDLLQDWYGLSQFRYTFSGHKGFHLYVTDYPEQCLTSTHWGPTREQYESQQRHRLTWQLRRAGIEFDYPISCDTRRILRIPYTLHGLTGLQCTLLSSKRELQQFTLEDAQPSGYSVLQNELIQVRVERYLPPFVWAGNNYSGKRGDYMHIPLSLAVLLLLQQDVKLLPNSSLTELLRM